MLNVFSFMQTLSITRIDTVSNDKQKKQVKVFR